MPGSSPATLGKRISDIHLMEKPPAAAIAKQLLCLLPLVLPQHNRTFHPARGTRRTRPAAPLPLSPHREGRDSSLPARSNAEPSRSTRWALGHSTDVEHLRNS